MGAWGMSAWGMSSWMEGARASLGRVAIALGCVAAIIAPGASPDGPADASGTSYHGSLARAVLNRPIVDLAATSSGNGYWLVAADGGIFTFGDARYHGSTGNIALNQPIVGMASTPSGNGYWLAAADGGIFTFGDARFLGSTGAIALASPIVGMSATPSGNGYWLAAADGGIFSFGDARFFGSLGGRRPPSPVTGIAGSRDGGGYWLVGEDGSIHTFGNARHLGAATDIPPQTTVDIALSPGGGYWVATQMGAVHVANESGVFLVDPNLAARPPAEAITSELFGRINAERRARGMGTLAWSEQLAATANGWARHLASTGGFAHNNLQAVLASYGGSYAYLAENIYSGTGAASDSGSAHASLMRSAPHRTTLLTPQLETVGIGVVCVGNMVVVVEDFGISPSGSLPGPMATPPPTPFVSADEAGTACG